MACMSTAKFITQLLGDVSHNSLPVSSLGKGKRVLGRKTEHPVKTFKIPHL